MKVEFARVLTLLRKEKGVSQKSAAQELGISQALLSHYEKGLRECGLAFVVKAADFYGVSCDYLLGRSPQRTGATITVEQIPDPENETDKYFKNSILPTLNKKLISNSLNILFDLLDKCNNKTLTNEISSFLMLSVYRVFRILYGMNPKNNREMFTVPKTVANAKALAQMSLCESNAAAEKVKDPEALGFNQELMEAEYQLYAASLLNLIQTSEKKLESLGG